MKKVITFFYLKKSLKNYKGIRRVRSPQADTDIKSNIYFYILNLHIKIEEGAAASSHDIIRSITMIHCVPSASALRQWRPITFIWHFMAVRSQQLSAMLKGGHRLPRLQKRSRRERARRELEELGERRRRGREGGREGWEKARPPPLRPAGV